MTATLDQLQNVGFEYAGQWRREDERLLCELEQFKAAKKVLYAFVSNNIVYYIGKTVQTLQQRMQGYKYPNESQKTNARNNQLIHKELDSLRSVEIYVLLNKKVEEYMGFEINLAAGLEDSLIEKLKPAWNGLKYLEEK
jgi:hypothetical protein